MHQSGRTTFSPIVHQPRPLGDLGRSSARARIHWPMFDRKRRPSLQKTGCLISLVLFSAYVAIVAHPAGAWKFGAAFAALALVSIVLRVGWFVPFTIAGTYAGMMLDAGVKGGTIESQMQETVTSIVREQFVDSSLAPCSIPQGVPIRKPNTPTNKAVNGSRR